MTVKVRLSRCALRMHSTFTDGEMIPSRRGKYPRLELWDARSWNYSVGDSLGEALTYAGFDGCEIVSLSPFARTLWSKLHESGSLLPKLLFFKHSDSHQSWSRAKRLLSSNPTALSHDLVSTIAPRHAYLVHHKIFANNWQSEENLNILICKDDDFESFCDNQIQSSINTVEGSQFTFKAFRRSYLRGGLAAIKSGELDMLSLFLQQGWHPNSDIDRQRRTALMWAVANPSGVQRSIHYEIVQRLLTFLDKHNILHQELRRKSLHGDSVLHWAVTASDNLSVFVQLLDRLNSNLHRLPVLLDGDEALYVNLDNTHVVHWAAGSGALDILRFLLESKPNGLASSDASRLLQYRNRFGCTLLHFAASGGQVETLKYLHEHYRHLDFTVQNYHGHDILTKAVAFKQNDVLLWLLQTIPAFSLQMNCKGDVDAGNGVSLLHKKRPWSLDTTMHSSQTVRGDAVDWTEGKEEDGQPYSLLEIADIVGNLKGKEILLRFWSPECRPDSSESIVDLTDDLK